MLSSGYIQDGQVVFFEGADRIYQKEFRRKKISGISIPDTIQAIQSEAFASCDLTSITIPDSVKKIGTRCFEGCTGLTKVVLPSGLKVIDEYVFRECSSLEEIVIPDSVTKIAKGAFMGCGSLSKVVLPKKLKTIGEYAFSNCKIETLDFPGSLERVEKDAFLECPFTKLRVPGNVKYLSGFRHTTLEDVTLEEGLETIGEVCFSECASLTCLKVPESVRKIERCAFMECGSLQTLILPKRMEVLEDEAFGGCVKLGRIDVPEANEVFAIESGCLVDKRKRELLHVLPDATEFPKNLKSINLPGGLFPPLYDVEELVIPEGVTSLSHLPFERMKKLKKLVLPVSLQRVDSYFFDDYPFSSVSVSPDLLLSNRFYHLPGRVDLIGVESVSDELRGKIVERFKGNDWIFVYATGQMIYPTDAGLKAREKALLEQKKKEMSEKVEDTTLLSLCKSTFDPRGFAFQYLESGNKLTVTIFDSLKIEHSLKMDTAEADLAALLDVATSYREALNPYITASSSPHLVTKADWEDYGESEYISSEPLPDVLVRLSLEPGSVAEAFDALENLEKAYSEMLRKYGVLVENLVRHDSDVR